MQLATRAVAVRAKKNATRVLVPSAGAVPSQGLVYGRGIVFGASGTDDLIGGAEDFLGALSDYRFGIKTTSTAEPILKLKPLQNSAPSSPKDSQQRSATNSASTSRKLRGVVSSSAKSASVVWAQNFRVDGG